MLPVCIAGLSAVPGKIGHGFIVRLAYELQLA